MSAPDLPPLTDRYSGRALNLWRWTDSDLDESRAAFVAAFARIDGLMVDSARLDDLRAAMTTEQHHEILVFAQRSAFASVRADDPALARAALHAMSAVAEAKLVDERMIWPVAALVLYAAARLGKVGAALGEEVIERADRSVRAALRSILEDGVDLMQDAGLREVRTAAGAVFLTDDGSSYQPEADLTAVAFSVADAVEADGYLVETVGVGYEVHPYLTGGDRDPGAERALEHQTGASHVDSVPVDGPYQPLSVRIVELASERDAMTVAAAADRLDSPEWLQLAVASDRLCAVLSVDKVDHDEPFVESHSALQRFRPGLLDALAHA